MGLTRFVQLGMPKVVDAVGLHNLRGTWSDDHPSSSLRHQAFLVQQAWGRKAPVWLTEYGLPISLLGVEGRGVTTDWLEHVQVALFAYAVYASIAGWFERIYWYTYKDEEHESLRFVTTGWEDKLQWYFGDTDQRGNPRLLARLLLEGGPIHVLRYAVKNQLMSLVDQASLGRQMQKAA